MKLVFDIETDGFLQGMTKVHCFATIDPESGEIRKFRNNIIRFMT